MSRRYRAFLRYSRSGKAAGELQAPDPGAAVWAKVERALWSGLVA